MDALVEHLGAAFYLLAGLVALLPSSQARALGAAGVAVIGLAAAADAVGAPAAGTRFTTINELLALSGFATVLVSLVLALRGGGSGGASRPRDAAGAPARLGALLPVALLLTVLGLHLLLLGAGLALGVVVAAGTTLRAGRSALPLGVLGLASLGVGAGLYLLLTIIGPWGGSVAGLGEAPLSPAAERLLTLLWGLGTLLLAGVPPLHRVPWGVRLAPLAAAVLLRVIVPSFPFGLVTWQAPAMLILALGVLWAAWRADWSLAATAGGLLALWSGAEAAVAGAVLVAWGWLVAIGTAVAARRGIRLAERWRGLAALPAAFAGLPALRAGLGAQVLVSVVAVAGCAAGLLLRAMRRPGSGQAPLY